MNMSRSSLSASTDIVADSSGVINLNATGFVAEILRAIPHRVILTDNAMRELEEGRNRGHNDAAIARRLIKEGFLCNEAISDSGWTTYEQLIVGNTASTLDDGEAATISHALQRSAIAMIDERKAMNICRASYPGLVVMPTVELLLSSPVAQALGSERHMQAVLGALRNARMRVPLQFVDEVRRLIGQEAAASCPCLPRIARGSR
jgi:predicted nucleic acid-binding protein